MKIMNSLIMRIGMNNILESIPDKRIDKSTTSLKFKQDLIDFLKEDYMDKTCLEIGAHRGYTTRVLSFLFKKVISCEYKPELIKLSQELNNDRNNIDNVRMDVYGDKWNFQNIDVIFIDCDHEYTSVMSDIKNSIELTEIGKSMLLIFDDYGLDNPWRGVKEAVNDYLTLPNFNIIKTIGEQKGSDCRPGKLLKDVEGVICLYEN